MTHAPSVLLLTRHYPPLVTAGARRPFLLARGLREAGCEVVVCAPALPAGERGLIVPHPAAEASSGAEDEVSEALRTPLRDWARAQLSLPDPDLRWSLRAAGHAKTWAARTGFSPDWVLTTSPPESVHVAGARLARALGARRACDLRDGWLDDPLLAQRRRRARRWAEGVIVRRLLRAADLVAAPTKAILEEARRHAPGVQTILLPQPGVASSLAPAVEGGDGVLTVLHTGSFSSSHDQRGIAPLVRLAAAYAGDPRVRFVLRGRLTGAERAAAREAGMEVRPPAPLETVWAEQASADVLVLVAAQGTRAVPGKLAEYRAAGRPVICLGGGPWREALPGHELAPEALLERLIDPAARGGFVPAPPPSPRDAADLLLDAMAASA